MDINVQGKLTSENPVSEDLDFVGEAVVLIHGFGSVQIERKINDSDFFPLTSAGGEPVTLVGEGEVIFNSELVNPARACTYRIVLIGDGEVEFYIRKGW